MHPTSSEISNVQNPAISAALLWKFGLGYQSESQVASPPLLLLFLPLPICFHKPTLDLVLSTRANSGLSLFLAKLAEAGEELFAVHERALAYKALTLDALKVGIQSKLLSVDHSSSAVRSNLQRLPVVAERVKPLLQGAERLGAWCARLPIEQVASSLRVEF